MRSMPHSNTANRPTGPAPMIATSVSWVADIGDTMTSPAAPIKEGFNAEDAAVAQRSRGANPLPPPQARPPQFGMLGWQSDSCDMNPSSAVTPQPPPNPTTELAHLGSAPPPQSVSRRRV